MKIICCAPLASSLLLTAALVSGCSAIVDSARYVGGGRDGGTDAGIPANAPSTPEIELVPSAPVTTDDLEVTITAPSTDPESGTVSYEYRWLRDDTAVPEHTTSTLPASATAKDETWRVEVTPVAEPGTRRGAPATAEVTIANSPPVLTTVALDGYMPAVGEMLRASAGPVVDADEETTSLRYQWHLDEVAIEGANASSYATTTATPGARVHLEAWANDGTVDGPVVTVGPVVLVADVTRWRPIAPQPFGDGFAHVAYDAPNRRHVRLEEGRLWEHWVSGTEVHTAPIPLPAGGPPLTAREFVSHHDPAGRRLLVRDMDDPALLHVLDLSQRGAETWSATTPDGTPPIARFGPATFHDAEANVLWVFGGLRDGETPAVSGELWSLDLAVGAERWVRHDVSGATLPATFGATMVADPTTPGDVLLFGGAALTGGSGVELLTTMFRLTLGEGDVVAEELATTLPRGAFGVSSVAVADRIVMAGGATEIDDPTLRFGAWSFDPATGTFVESTDTIPSGAFGTAALDPDDATRVLWTRGTLESTSSGSGAGFELYAIDPATAGLTAIALEVRPPAISDGAVGGRSEMILVSGALERQVPIDVVWQLDLRTGVWTASTPLPDAVTNTSPTPRFGTMMAPSSPWARPQLFTGATDSSGLADSQVWELLENRWLLRSLAVGVPAPPPPRRGAAFIGGGGCGADQNYFFGGENASGALLGDNGTLVCAEGERLRNCYWEVAAESGATAPLPRAHATLGVDPAAYVWMIGGRTVFGAANHVYSFSSCTGGPAPWNVVAPMGAAFPPRYAHSAALVPGEGGGLTSFVVFGGLRGEDESMAFNDTWRLELTSELSARWVPIMPAGALPRPRAYHQAMWDEGRDRLVVFGGRTPNETLGDIWELLVRP